MSAEVQTTQSFYGPQYLRQLKLLMRRDQQSMYRVNAMMRTTKCRRGEWLFVLGDPSDTIYFLEEGRMKLTALSEDGQEVLLEVIGPGEIFGDVGVIHGMPRTTSAQALDDSLLREVRRTEFEALLATHPEMTFHFLKSIGLRLKKAEAQLLNFVCNDVSTRVKEALLDLMDVESGAKPNPPIKIGITQQDLANLIGASRQKTWHALKELEDLGTLRLKYGRIIVTAPEKLLEPPM